MLEKDIQLRAQLEKIDQYFEEEIRKKYLFMDEAIKQKMQNEGKNWKKGIKCGGVN